MLSFIQNVLHSLLSWLTSTPFPYESNTVTRLNGGNEEPLTRKYIEQLLSRVSQEGLDLSGKCLNGVDFSRLNLQNVNLRDAQLRNCKFNYANLQNADLTQSDCSGADFIDAQLRFTLFYRANLEKAKFTPYSFRRKRWQRIRGINVWEIGDVVLAKKLNRIKTYHHARETCLAIAGALQGQGHYDDAAEIRIIGMRCHRTTKSPVLRFREGSKGLTSILHYSWKWISLYLADALCVYGESISRVLFWMICLLFVITPAIISMAGGLSWLKASEQVEIFASIQDGTLKQLYVYLQYVIYSLDTLTTADFSPLEPRNDIVRLFSGLLALAGIFLAGLLGFVTGNRIRRV